MSEQKIKLLARKNLVANGDKKKSEIFSRKYIEIKKIIRVISSFKIRKLLEKKINKIFTQNLFTKKI